jgi:DNA-binding transcriptional regulator YiaG
MSLERRNHMTPTEFRATLRALNLTQRSLAERLGLAISTVNRWAKRQVEIPQYAVAYLEERQKAEKAVTDSMSHTCTQCGLETMLVFGRLP